jgi:hypothetical protein
MGISDVLGIVDDEAREESEIGTDLAAGVISLGRGVVCRVLSASRPCLGSGEIALEVGVTAVRGVSVDDMGDGGSSSSLISPSSRACRLGDICNAGLEESSINTS